MPFVLTTQDLKFTRYTVFNSDTGKLTGLSSVEIARYHCVPSSLRFGQTFDISWWRHHVETFSVLLALCVGNSPVTGEFPSQRPVTQSFDVFFDLRLNKRLSKQSWGWWFETPLRPIWRHCNVMCGHVAWTHTLGSEIKSVHSALDCMKHHVIIILHSPYPWATDLIVSSKYPVCNYWLHIKKKSYLWRLTVLRKIHSYGKYHREGYFLSMYYWTE